MTPSSVAGAERVAIRPEGGDRPALPYSPAVKAGGWVFVSGQTAATPGVGLPPEAMVDPESPFLGNQLEREARQVMKGLDATLRAAGCDLRRDVVRIYQWLPSPHPTPEEFEQGSSTTGIPVVHYNRVFDEFIDLPRPASTAMGVRRLPPAGTHVQTDLIAMEPRPGRVRQGFDFPADMPQPVGKYSPALRSGDWVFLAGDLPTDFRGDFLSERRLGDPSGLAPEARVNPYFWYGSSTEAQVDYTLAKLERLAEVAGSSLARCVKAYVYMGHPQDYFEIDRAWRRWFPENPPARVLVPFTGLAVRGARIEIALTLLADDSSLTIETVETSSAPEPIGHAPQAVRAGSFLFFSGLLPVDSHGRLAAETKAHPSFPFDVQPAKLQMRYLLGSAAAIAEAGGSSLDNVCRGQAFYDDLRHYAAATEEWQAHFPGDPPAGTSVELGGPLFVPGVHTTLDLIGYVPGGPSQPGAGGSAGAASSGGEGGGSPPDMTPPDEAPTGAPADR